MGFLVLIAISCMFILKTSCGSYPGWYTSLNYRFSPTLGDCYEIYDQNEKVTSSTCQRSANLEKQSCIDWIPGDKLCLGLKTPTNETIEFICEDKPEEVPYRYDMNTCFKVHNVDKTFKTVCQQNFDANSIGITTPDNFTIMFESHNCKTSMSVDERKMFNNFVNSYSFDPELKSCYKIFNPDQTVSPYTCLNKDVHDSCVHELPKNKKCMGVITQNNETIVLDCSESDEKSWSTSNCFKIYSSDGNVHVTCQKKIEERCVGIITPSNLTVLLDCLFCSIPHVKYTKYDGTEIKRKHRHFVKSYLNKEYKGEHSYLETVAFEVFDKNDFVKSTDCSETKPKVYAYWLPNTYCYGLTLESNETIILECTSKDKEVKPGCFQVVNSEEEKTTVCIRALDELCVGITTPSNLSLILACYPTENCTQSANNLPPYQDQFRKMFRKFVENALHNYTHGYYAIKQSYPVFKDYYEEKTVHLLRGHNNCRGLTLNNFETIVLECPNKGPKKHGCFDVYSPKYEKRNSPEQKVESVCIKVLDERCVGIVTPDNWTLTLDCVSKPHTHYVQTYYSAVSVPFNGMPPRM